ncbi:Uncharacterized protein APZ42_031115 [Daphnia magna]|uniref:Uncharacterized protein n=1 Tax=Daphnia magna TaxID=35525 RepID=A0A162DC78_9CRUS|nr:Uncharacterized protein APZ42_031115 [Daphnia magna]
MSSGSGSDNSNSSSSDSSTDSSSSDSSFLSKFSTRKFEFSKSGSTSLAKWIVTGIKDEKVKACREAFKPTLKRKSEFLVNPTLDESIYLRLKVSKNSNASKTNIDPTEKTLKKLSYKILDLIKPLLYLASRANLKKRKKSDFIATQSAIRLWATLFRDIIKSRKQNILAQVYPEFINLLDRSDIWSGGEDLFGRKFLRHLVNEAKAQSTLEGISKVNKKASPRSTRSLHPPRIATRALLETLLPISSGREIPTLTPLNVTGILNWAAHSVNYAPAHCRNLQAFYAKHSKSAKVDLSARLPLSQKARGDLD